MTYEEKLDEVLEWQKQQTEKDRRIKELEAQIEKMKCCQNCSHLCSRCELGIDGCYVCSKWEIKEND